MPGGLRDSSKTRVAPVFNALRATGDAWVPQLLALATGGAAESARTFEDDLTFVEGHWYPHERALDPPISLLSWLIRNVEPRQLQDDAPIDKRRRLIERDPDAVAEALKLLRSNYTQRDWFIFEGPTYPDVVLITKRALVVVEGKRTEHEPTTTTKWLPGRYQIWRHIDGAWEIRGNRAVYGILIVEGDTKDDGGRAVPTVWRNAARVACEAAALDSSFPHRSATEARAICSCFLGVTTWQKVCHEFGIAWTSLPDRV